MAKRKATTISKKPARLNKQEISLKNAQAYRNRKIKAIDKEIEKLTYSAKGNLNKFVKEKGKDRPRKLSTIIAEKRKKQRAEVKQLKQLTKERVKVTGKAYKPKKGAFDSLGGETKPKKGILTIGHFLAWEERDAFNIVFNKGTFFGKDILKFQNIWIDTDYDKAVQKMQELFKDMQSNDIVILKFETETGNVIGQRSKNKYKGNSAGTKYKK
jgi:hypothetical protein